jgi:hypothetical protein
MFCTGLCNAIDLLTIVVKDDPPHIYFSVAEINAAKRAK